MKLAKKKETETFDLQKALEECPKPDWYKKAFVVTMDLSKVKSQKDLIKLFKEYGELK